MPLWYFGTRGVSFCICFFFFLIVSVFALLTSPKHSVCFRGKKLVGGCKPAWHSSLDLREGEARVEEWTEAATKEEMGLFLVLMHKTKGAPWEFAGDGWCITSKCVFWYSLYLNPSRTLILNWSYSLQSKNKTGSPSCDFIEFLERGHENLERVPSPEGAGSQSSSSSHLCVSQKKPLRSPLTLFVWLPAKSAWLTWEAQALP